MNETNKNFHSIQTTHYHIKIINSEETHQIRHPVLRAGKSIDSCVFEGDNHETTIHLGLYINTKIIGICSFFKNNNKNIFQEHQYQLRGMAILKEFQGKGLGSTILSYGEIFLKEKKTKTIWCNAREVALHFYKQNGYQVIGNPFNIENIGIHNVMYKNL